MVSDYFARTRVSVYVVTDVCEERGRTILKKWQTKAALGIKRPNMHKLRTLDGGRKRLGERRGVDSFVVLVWVGSIPSRSLSNTRHQYSLVIVFSLSPRTPLPFFQICLTTAKAAAAVVATSSSIVPITVLHAKARTPLLFE